MATKEDILEQIVEEYLIQKGYFVQHNIKFRPRKDHLEFDSKTDSNYSDIDVIGIHPRLSNPQRVMVVSCKSWQAGFNPQYQIDAIREGRILGGRPAWKIFRELTVSKWSEAFVDRSAKLLVKSSLRTQQR